jgi:hypothetical protein
MNLGYADSAAHRHWASKSDVPGRSFLEDFPAGFLAKHLMIVGGIAANRVSPWRLTCTECMDDKSSGPSQTSTMRPNVFSAFSGDSLRWND